MKTAISKYSVELLFILNALLLILPLYVAFRPNIPEDSLGYIALSIFLAWVPVGITATIVAIHRLLTAKKMPLGRHRTIGLTLAMVTILLNLISGYIFFFTNMF